MKQFNALSLALCLAVITGLVAGCAVPWQRAGSAAEPSSGIVKANGIDIAYESFGSPEHETVLLIAGTGRQLTDWPLELVKQLSNRGYRVVRFDNRDVGLSTKFDAAGTGVWRAEAHVAPAGQR